MRITDGKSTKEKERGKSGVKELSRSFAGVKRKMVYAWMRNRKNGERESELLGNKSTAVLYKWIVVVVVIVVSFFP